MPATAYIVTNAARNQRGADRPVQHAPQALLIPRRARCCHRCHRGPIYAMAQRSAPQRFRRRGDVDVQPRSYGLQHAAAWRRQPAHSGTVTRWTPTNSSCADSACPSTSRQSSIDSRHTARTAPQADTRSAARRGHPSEAGDTRASRAPGTPSRLLSAPARCRLRCARSTGTCCATGAGRRRCSGRGCRTLCPSRYSGRPRT